MKLFSADASPFARKVRVAAHEIGLAHSIELVTTTASPVDRNMTIAAHNPTGRIPTLVDDDGTAIFDSRVVCERLDFLNAGEPLIPREANARIATLVLNALADGAMETTVLLRYETALRPEEYRWPAWIDGARGKIDASLDRLQSDWLEHLENRLDLGVIAAGCALGYLDFRFPDIDWRSSRAPLAAWYESFAGRPSMQATKPAG